MSMTPKQSKATEFKFHAHVLVSSPDMTPYFFSKRTWPGSRDSWNFILFCFF